MISIIELCIIAGMAIIVFAFAMRARDLEKRIDELSKMLKTYADIGNMCCKTLDSMNDAIESNKIYTDQVIINLHKRIDKYEDDLKKISDRYDKLYEEFNKLREMAEGGDFDGERFEGTAEERSEAV